MASERVQRQIDRLLDEAEEASAQRQWEVVRDRAEHVLTFDPNNPDGLAFLASADRALGGSSEPSRTDSAQITPNITPTSESQPTSFANGRYQVKRFLGEGGKKKVYLANDTLLDRDVAFALIKTEGLDDLKLATLPNRGYHVANPRSLCTLE